MSVSRTTEVMPETLAGLLLLVAAQATFISLPLAHHSVTGLILLSALYLCLALALRWALLRKEAPAKEIFACVIVYLLVSALISTGFLLEHSFYSPRTLSADGTALTAVGYSLFVVSVLCFWVYPLFLAMSGLRDPRYSAASR